MLNIRKKAQKLFPLMAVLLSGQACMESIENNFDFEGINTVNVKPSIAIPLVHGKLEIKDLLPQEESSYLEIREDNLIHLIYSDTLASKSILEHFLLQSLFIEETYPVLLSTTNLPGASPTISFTKREELDLNFEEADFDQISLKNGKLVLDVTNNVSGLVDVQITLPTLTKEGIPLTETLNFTGSSTTPKKREIDLKGYFIDLEDFGPGENRIPIDIDISATNNNQSLVPDGSIKVGIAMEELEHDLLTGFFGELDVDLPSEEVELASFNEIFGKANVGFKSAHLSFDIINSNGVEIKATTHSLYASNINGDKLNLIVNSPNPISIGAPAMPGEENRTLLEVTNENEIFNFAPSSIVYNLTGRINEGVPAGTKNFLTDKSETTVVLNANIPLWGYMNGFTLVDTMNLDLGLDTKETDYINDATILIKVVNQFPLNADVKIDFVDGGNKVLYTLKDGVFNLIPGSKVDADGNMTQEGKLVDEISIPSTKFESILRAQKVIITANFETSKLGSAHPYVKIKSNQSIGINIGVKASAKNLKFDISNEGE